MYDTVNIGTLRLHVMVASAREGVLFASVPHFSRLFLDCHLSTRLREKLFIFILKEGKKLGLYQLKCRIIASIAALKNRVLYLLK